MNDQEKSEMGTKTFIGFLQQFGDDIYSQILMEELFKGLMYEEALFIFGESFETGDQTCDSSPERICDDIQVDGPIIDEPPANMAEEDFSNYP